MNLKKFTQKDRFGNMLSYEFEANVPEMNKIPPAFQPGPKGTDTVPAWLTPGENVINAEASRMPGVQPMLDKLNDMGRAIQKEQGGSIPSYAQEGSKVTSSLLDGILQTESGGDPTKVSPVGASGPYQIMKDTALNPGFGVQPISLEDRFDPTKSRAFAEAYLKGIEKANPDFTTEQLLQAYHSGVGNVKKGNIGPIGQAYPDKVINYGKESIKPDAMSAMASTNNKEVPKENKPLFNLFGDKYTEANKRRKENKNKYGPDVILDSLGNVQQVNPNRISENIPQDLANKLANKEITQQQYNNQINDYNKAVKQNEAFKDQESSQQEVTQEIENDKNKNRIDEINELIKANPNDKVLIKTLEEEKAKLKKNIIEKEDSKQTVISKTVANNIVNRVGDDPSGADLVAELYAQDESSIAQKGFEQTKEVLDKVGGWFEQTFKDMFSGPELARMAIMYAGSRALGYNHNASLKYSAKNYLDRVDKAAAARKKFALQDSSRDDFTMESLKKYSETGNINDLELKPVDSSMVKMTGRGYLRGYGQVTLFEGKDKNQYAQIGNKYIRTSKLPIEQYDDKVMGDVAVAKRFDDFEDNLIKSINRNIDDDDKKISRDLVGTRLNSLYRDILRRNGVSINDAPQTEIAMQQAIRAYYQDKAEGKEPKSIEAYVNKQVFTPLSGISQTMIGDASAETLQKLSNMVRRGMDNQDPKTRAYAEEFKLEWQSVLEAFKKSPESERAKYVRQAAETKGHSALTLFFEDKGVDGIEAILKGN